MNKNEEITILAEEIMVDITNNRLLLHNILLKASRLSLLIDIPVNVNLFKDWAKYAEQNSFVVDSFKINIESARDPNVSVSSANEYEHVSSAVKSNYFERNALRQEAQKVVNNLGQYRAETYNFALGVYTKWKFGNVAESIFDKKRKRTEPILREIFPDINQRLNSIERNIKSDNPEDWKNAVASCRTLFMDIADIVNPASNSEDKPKYINRLKDFISPLVESETKKALLTTFFEEIKKRIEYTLAMTQGGAHKDRPLLEEAENVILYTYLIISDLMEIYKSKDRTQEITKPAESITKD